MYIAWPFVPVTIESTDRIQSASVRYTQRYTYGHTSPTENIENLWTEIVVALRYLCIFRSLALSLMQYLLLIWQLAQPHAYTYTIKQTLWCVCVSVRFGWLLLLFCLLFLFYLFVVQMYTERPNALWCKKRAMVSDVNVYTDGFEYKIFWEFGLYVLSREFRVFLVREFLVWVA